MKYQIAVSSLESFYIVCFRQLSLENALNEAGSVDWKLRWTLFQLV
jgi:hypothetical protein